MSLQILQCGDLHLDRNFNISNMLKANQRKNDLFNNFSEIIEFALKDKPDLFLITGDVFDRISPSNYARVFLTQKIKRLNDSGIKIFIIGGNHDVPKVGQSSHLAVDVLRYAGLATVFSSSEIIQKEVLSLEGKSVCISGKSYFPQFENTNPLQNIKVPLEGQYNILIIHGSLQGLNVITSVPEMANQNPFHADDIPIGLNHLALGHFHNYFVRDYENCKIVNTGSIEKLTWSEINDDKGFAWIELNGSESKCDFLKLPTRKMENLELELSNDIANVKDYVMEYLKNYFDPEKIVRLNLKGELSQDQYGKLKINEIYNACKDSFFVLDLRKSELEIEGYGRTFFEKIDSPMDAFSKRLDMLIQKTGEDEENKKFLEEVKRNGIKYLERE